MRLRPEQYVEFVKMKEELVMYLRQLGHQEIVPEDRELGLCHILRDFTRSNAITGALSSMAIRYWPLYSGHCKFPVPTYHKKGPIRMFTDLEDKWTIRFYHSKARKEYIRNRLDLCLWLADRIEEGVIDHNFVMKDEPW